MKKKIFIGVGIFILISVIGMFYLDYRNRTLSPPGLAEYDKNGLKIEIKYSKPSVRMRLIFGTADEGALQPYGKYWRLGANEATEIIFNKDVLFNGNEVNAGSYTMYAVPGEQEFEISLNSEVGKWGYSEPDYNMDVLKTMIPTGRSPQNVEQFNIRFEDIDPVMIVCEWADVKIKIPVQVD